MEKIEVKEDDFKNAKIKGMKKVLNFYDIPNTKSSVSCHGKPTKNDIKIMKEKLFVTTVLTLLHDKEKPQQIEKFCKENEVTWYHIVLLNPSLDNMKNEETQNLIAEGISIICKQIIDAEIKLFIHCAAGVHRTGTILYLILRACGEDIKSTMKAIKSIRLETFINVGQWRLDFAEKFILPLITSNLDVLK